MTADGIECEDRMSENNPAGFDEAAQLALTVPILVRGDKVEVGWKGESG